MSLNAGFGRRAQNKSEKLARIISATRNLLESAGESGVTTAQVAKSADVAAGTLFLYAKNKGELLLLAQNADYVVALSKGIKQSESASNLNEALTALWTPIFECNRKHVENGRAYLREVMFGDSAEPNHVEALSMMAATGAQTEKLLSKYLTESSDDCAQRSASVSALAYVVLSSPANVNLSIGELTQIFMAQIQPSLRGR